MGSEQSTTEKQPTQAIKPIEQNFYKYRNENTIEDALKCMNMLGMCVNNVEPSAIESYVKDGINIKVLFVIVNTYNKPNYKLGVGPLNDSIKVSLDYIKKGYRMIYLHNSTPGFFLKWFKFILKNTETDLEVFYSGHGNLHESMLFDKGYIFVDDLSYYLSCYAHGQRIVLLSDNSSSNNEEKGISSKENPTKININDQEIVQKCQIQESNILFVNLFAKNVV